MFNCECGVSAYGESCTTLCVFETNKPHALHRRNHERNAQQESHSKSGFSFSEHCRACTKQCSEITKDAVQSTAFLLHIAEDSKGKTLSEADASMRSSQFCLSNYCRADAVKDKRSEVNHIIANA